MSRALLKFEKAEREGLEAGILADAIEASPEPLAVAENGKVIYSNASFAQVSSESGKVLDQLHETDSRWNQTEFATGGRRFSVTTRRHEVSELTASDGNHLAIVGRLVGGVAHDFNNLLTGILLYCDLLQSKTDTKTLWSKVDEIRRAAEHGAGLIRQLMTLGRDEGSARTVSFNHVVLELEPLLRHLLGEHIRISVDLTDGSGLVGLSAAEAQQIILNLALNARDAMPNGGSLRLESRFRGFEGTGPAGRIFEFTVSDSGEGMNADIARRIFEPFFTTKSPEHGTGMGLATVRKIVEDAGGNICVETSPGNGTRMMVQLPETGRNDATLRSSTEVSSDESKGAAL